MTKQTREEIIKQAQNEAYIYLQDYMRHRYYYGNEDWEEELPNIEGAYGYGLWTSLLTAYLKHRPACSTSDCHHLTFAEVRELLDKKDITFFELEYTTPVTKEELDKVIAMYDDTIVTSGQVAERVLEDYYKEKSVYEETSESCEQALEEVLEEFDAYFSIDIVSFRPDKFYGYVTFKEDLDTNAYYQTTLATLQEDTIAALNQLKSNVQAGK